jgi:uncharacterized SAM-binding protein YcdF (DUF218 family)
MEPPRRHRPSWTRRVVRRLARGTAKLALLAGAAFAGGFVAFVVTLPQPPGDAPAAQGIVVLTGGDERIDVALELLKERRGDRLLISGLHAATSRDALRRAHHGDESTFACCIDLGWEARDTPGNASETARWARAHGYRSLIVVTASYHMPRALLELGTQMDGIALIPYPVTPDALARPDAWRDPATLQLVAGEYMKYVAAQARITGDSLLRLAGI